MADQEGEGARRAIEGSTPRTRKLKLSDFFLEKKSFQGDNDPVDVVEIGEAECAMGSVTPVKPLGDLAMIDDGELDWKVSLFFPITFFFSAFVFFARSGPKSYHTQKTVH